MSLRFFADHCVPGSVIQILQQTGHKVSVNGEAKPYQIKQFLRLVERHNLKLEESE